MDHTEDLSARVLLKNILSTEPPRTPITRSATAAPSDVSSATRRSSRGGNKDVVAQTPQDMLRRSMRHKIRESITRKSLPATKRRTASVVIKKVNTPGQPSMLFDDGDTPRHILKNILLTEPVRSPVVHDGGETGEPQPSSASSGTTSKRPSIELSGLDLPDITIGNAASIVKGLSRKRPRRSLNVTAFEKRLKGGEDVEEEIEEALNEQSSLSLSSSTSLSLKTPFVDVRTERKHLQRRVSNRRKITEEEFGAAVDKRQMGEVSAFVERGHNETTFSEGLTLGFSKLSEPDITTDILHCNTALYAQPDAMTANFSIVATQDKPTVMASQIQRQMMEEEAEEELMEAAQNVPGEVGSLYLFPTEEEVVEECQIEEGSSHGAAHGQHEDAAAMLQTSERDDTAESEEDEKRVEAQTEEENEEDGSADSQAAEDEEDEEEEEEEGGADSQPEEEVATRSQSDEEEVVSDSKTEEEEGAVDSQTEDLGTVEEEGDVVEYQSGQEDPAAGGLADSQTEDDEEEEEEGGVESQPEDDVATRSRSEEEEVVPDSQTEEEEKEKEEGAVESQTEELDAVEEEGDVVEYQSGREDPSEGGLADSQAEAELDGMAEEEDDEQAASEQLAPNFEHISRRSHYSAGGVMLVREAEGLSDATEAEWSDGKSKAHSAVDVHSSLEIGTHESGPHHTEIPEVAESSSQGQRDASGSEAEQDADKENSVRLSEEEAAQDSAEQEEEWEDGDDAEENEEVPSKTPAFVKQKRSFFHPDPLASPVLKDVQASSSTGESLPATKPKKQMRKREPSKKKGGLPKSYLMSVFKHFAKAKVSADVYPALQETMDKFFERMADDLETYALHAKRKTIEVEDAELLLKRQGYINDKVPVEVLIEKYLRMDQRKLLIPIATSGNVVIPKKRR